MTQIIFTDEKEICWKFYLEDIDTNLGEVLENMEQQFYPETALGEQNG